MKKYRVPYGGMLLGEAEKKAIMRVVNKNWWPAGPEAEKMEAEAAKYLGLKYGILANSGSSAGLLALTALELPRNSEVIIPAVTFPTIFSVILQCGHIPVVVDCEIGTYNIDVRKLEEAISPKTRAIICVHAVGNPCDMKAINKLAKKYGLKVIEDNCDGWGGNLGKKKVGAHSDISFTSFHAAHIVSMGQGGGVFTNDKELARKVRMYRDWGRQSTIKERMNNDKWPELPRDQDARFIYEKPGFNLGPLELQAAMGRVQLKKTEKIKKLRKYNFHWLRLNLKRHEDLIMPHWVDDADPSWFSFPLSSKNYRYELIQWLEECGIETRSMFTGNVLRHPGFKNVKHRVGNSLVQADWILKHSFWLSCHPRMTEADRMYVLTAFDTFYARIANRNINSANK